MSCNWWWKKPQNISWHFYRGRWEGEIDLLDWLLQINKFDILMWLFVHCNSVQGCFLPMIWFCWLNWYGIVLYSIELIWYTSVETSQFDNKTGPSHNSVVAQMVELVAADWKRRIYGNVFTVYFSIRHKIFDDFIQVK